MDCRAKSFRYRDAIVVAMSLAGVWMAGCGHQGAVRPHEATVAAAGTVTFQGKALENYQVLLVPPLGTPAVGVTDADGKFTLGTNRPGDGAVTGAHKVSVVYVGPSDVAFDGINDFSAPPPPKVKIPAKYSNAETSGVSIEIPAQGHRDLKIELQ